MPRPHADLQQGVNKNLLGSIKQALLFAQYKLHLERQLNWVDRAHFEDPNQPSVEGVGPWSECASDSIANESCFAARLLS